MKRIKIALIVFLVCILLCACDSVKITSGTVINKEYRPSYTTIMPIYTGKFWRYIPMFHGESFVVTISGTDANGEEGTAYYTVPESVYSSLKIGDYYKAG